jgi:hypothetical protein
MAKQTFTTGQVLTAAQMTSLQQTAMLGGAASAKTASYTLVAADAGAAISMSNASATTITVNTALFAAGDTVQITNLGVGVCTITAGTATVNTASSLALAQYESGTLDFTSASAAVFYKAAGAAAGGGGKVLQVVFATRTTSVSVTGTTFTDTGLTATITPSLATSKVLVLVQQTAQNTATSADSSGLGIRLLRGATAIDTPHYSGGSGGSLEFYSSGSTGVRAIGGILPMTYLDSPATTSATTYKTQIASDSAGQTAQAQNSSSMSTITLLEIGA